MTELSPSVTMPVTLQDTKGQLLKAEGDGVTVIFAIVARFVCNRSMICLQSSHGLFAIEAQYLFRQTSPKRTFSIVSGTNMPHKPKWTKVDEIFVPFLDRDAYLCSRLIL